MWTESIVSGKAAVLVSAATGGAVAAIGTRGPWWARMATGFCGASVSYFLTPIAAPIAEAAMEWGVATLLKTSIDLDGPSVLGATGFALGVTGMEIMQFGVALLRGDRTISSLWRGRAAPTGS